MNDYRNMKAIFFDLDDTLCDREKYAYDCWDSLLKEAAGDQDPMKYEAMLQSMMIWEQKGNVEKNYIKNKLFQRYGVQLPYEDLNVEWENRLWRFCVPFADTRKTLEQLSQHYILGVITNGPSDGQRKKLQHAGLYDLFDPAHIFVSGDVPWVKPDPRIFCWAADKTGVQPEECLYAGDTFANDIWGAYQANMKPVLIWHDRPRRTKVNIPTLNTIAQLPDLLKGKAE